MTRRLLLAVVALAGLTAFAPAPFPKSQRDTISLERIQGTWKVISLEVIEKGNVPKQIDLSYTHIRVKEDYWQTLVINDGKINLDLLINERLAIDGTRKPARIDWFIFGPPRPERPGMVGIIRREGDRLRILSSGPENRPTSFENPPIDSWLLTLQRQP